MFLLDRYTEAEIDRDTEAEIIAPAKPVQPTKRIRCKQSDELLSRELQAILLDQAHDLNQTLKCNLPPFCSDVLFILVDVTKETAEKTISRISREIGATVWQADFGATNGKPLKLNRLHSLQGWQSTTKSNRHNGANNKTKQTTVSEFLALHIHNTHEAWSLRIVTIICAGRRPFFPKHWNC